MANPYATEAFLRKQCRLRDDRIQWLEAALRAAYDDLALLAVRDEKAFRIRKALDAVLCAETPKDIVAC